MLSAILISGAFTLTVLLQEEPPEFSVIKGGGIIDAVHFSLQQLNAAFTAAGLPVPDNYFYIVIFA